MQIHNATTTAAGLPFERLIPALQRRFALGCTVPTRHVHTLGADSAAPVTSLLMPAWVEGGCYGVKVINIAPGNAARGLPGLHATYLLHDATTGVPLAVLDGDALTARRTAAASALAASLLLPAAPLHLLVVGAGRVAQLLPAAYRAVRPLSRVTVWARQATQAEMLAARWRADGFDAHAAPDLPTAVRAADVVSCATLATAPLVQGAWLRPGSHLDLIGSFTPALREADDACFAGAALYIDTEEALAKSGDLLGPMSRAVITPGSVRGTLATLARGEAAARDSATQRTVFKSVGTALADLAAAMLVMGLGDA